MKLTKAVTDVERATLKCYIHLFPIMMLVFTLIAHVALNYRMYFWWHRGIAGLSIVNGPFVRSLNVTYTDIENKHWIVPEFRYHNNNGITIYNSDGAMESRRVEQPNEQTN